MSPWIEEEKGPEGWSRSHVSGIGASRICFILFMGSLAVSLAIVAAAGVKSLLRRWAGGVLGSHPPLTTGVMDQEPSRDPKRVF